MTTNISAVGILGVGLHLPSEIRRNDWWSDEVKAHWAEKANLLRTTVGAADAQTEGARRTLESMKAFEHDPFKGAIERRVMPKGVTPSDMELAAAEDSLARARMKRDDVGLQMVYSQLPDFLIVPNAPLLHQRLGLKRDCMSLDTQAACYSFLVQYALAEQMIKAGQGRSARWPRSRA